MLRASEGADVIVVKDETGELVLRTPTVDPKTKEPGWFGMVPAKKAYVSCHLPLYAAPELYDELEALTRRAARA